MKNFIQKHLVLIIITLLAGLSGVIYALDSTPQYSAISKVAVFRQKFEVPEHSSEEARNRWVWIRDGLSVQSSIVNDSVLNEIKQTIPETKILLSHYDGEMAQRKALLKMINIQFTGADEFNFVLEVVSPIKDVSIQINKILLKRLEYLVVTQQQKIFDQVLKELKGKMGNAIPKSENYLYFQEQMRKMTFDYTLTQVQREQNFQVTMQPFADDKPIWPKKKFIVLIALFIGFIAGIGCEVLMKSEKTA